MQTVASSLLPSMITLSGDQHSKGLASSAYKYLIYYVMRGKHAYVLHRHTGNLIRRHIDRGVWYNIQTITETQKSIYRKVNR